MSLEDGILSGYEACRSVLFMDVHRAVLTPQDVCHPRVVGAKDSPSSEPNETAMPAALDHRDRVLRSIEHRDIDRVACYFAAEAETQAMLQERLGLRDAQEATRFFDADTVQVTVYCALPDLSAVQRTEELEGLPWPSRERVDLGAEVARARAARATGLAVFGGAWATPYAASKGGVVQLTKALAVEWAEQNVRVNAVCPGVIRTPLAERGIEQAGALFGDTVEEAWQRIAEGHPLGRLGEPEEVARAVLFLASDEASYITGETVNINGGWFMD